MDVEELEEGARRPRVLIVEDHVDTSVWVAVLLEANGYACTVVRDAEAALTALDDERPDVALIDIGLPGIDGHELARRIRIARGPAIRLIATTGHGEASDRQLARDVGFDAFLAKPIGLRALLDAVADSGPRAG